jgi:hypothetical protein
MPKPEVLAARYARAVRKWHDAQRAMFRAEEAMRDAALAAVPLPPGSNDVAHYRYADFIECECRNGGLGPTHMSLADFIPSLTAFAKQSCDD